MLKNKIVVVYGVCAISTIRKKNAKKGIKCILSKARRIVKTEDTRKRETNKKRKKIET